MDNRKFWWLLTTAAMITTWLFLMAKGCEKQMRERRIENHSEITNETLNDK
jgi:hypothetical protein